MGKSWIIAGVGTVAVLAAASYLYIRMQPKPAGSFHVAIQSASRTVPPTPSMPSQSSSPDFTPQPEQPSARHHQTAWLLHSAATKQNSGAPQLRSAVDSSYPGAAPPAPAESSAEQAQPLASSGPGIVAANDTPALDNNSSVGSNAASTPPVAPASAVLFPHGPLLLNGKSITDSAALFPGDHVQIPAGSYASINAKGSLSVLQPGSSAVYTGKGIDLQQGGVAVSTQGGMPVDTEGLTIAPRSLQGKYNVLDDSGRVQIASLAGDLNITDGGQTTVLPQGQQTTRDRRKKAAGMMPSDTSAAPQTPPTASGGFPTAKVLIVSGVVGGGIVAAILLTRSSSKPASPAVP